MKKLALLLFVSLFAVSGTAWAIPTTLSDVMGNSLYGDYRDTGAEAVVLTDTDGFQDDATAYLLLEIAGYKNTNAFGIYGFSMDANDNVVLGDTLQVFAGADNAITSTTMFFDVQNGLVSVGKNQDTGELINPIDLGGITFGFYLDVNATGQRYYSHSSLNADGLDHMMIFDTSDNEVGMLLGSDVVIAMEDLPGLGDADYNDMVVGVSDVAPVPEPATMLMLGTGLLGLAGVRRKTKKQ